MKKLLINLNTKICTLLFIFNFLLSQSKDYPITPIPFSQVKIVDKFFAKKIETNHYVTIPIAVQKSQESGRIDNFKRAAGIQEGEFCSIYPFDDSDIYKIIEAASYSIQTFPDKKMELMIDSLIFFTAAAQEKDGYLYTNRTIKEGKPHEWAGDNRWELVNELSHELYNLGHLYEAASAHFIATGKRTLLDIAITSADLVCNTFGPGKIENYPGHQEIEIGLVKLYRITGNIKYLNMAKYFLDIRGQKNVGRPDRYNQSHLPVILQTEAVGHSVRAAYMWTAMADVAAITGNKEYIKAINTLWHDIVDTKYYINGGIGSTSSHEGFGPPYDLPNMTAYNETCAGVGNAMWNHRMFLMTGDGNFMDILERTMYNNILTGVSKSGDRFFYPNPLSSHGQYERSEWFGCACCPPNVARFLPSMPGYIYAQKNNDIYINLFISSKTSFSINDKNLTLTQQSGLPWEGDININIESKKPAQANLKIRIPGWARNKPVPGKLYRYINDSKKQTTIKINGELQNVWSDRKGYVTLSRRWENGDNIEIKLPMEIKVVKARKEVIENHDKIAIERGPLLYCAEGFDNGTVLNIVLDDNAKFTSKYDPDLFGGIVTISTMANKTRRINSDEILMSKSEPIKLIPYHLWNNRGPGEMRVWLPLTKSATRPLPAPTIANRSKLTASKDSRSIFSINDQIKPTSSGDQSNTYFHWWPKKGTWEWVQFDFSQKEDIHTVKVYWFDDGPKGETRIPDDWEVLYKNGKKWIPVKNKTVYNVSKDAWDTIIFDEVKTESIRIKLKLKKEYSAGVHEIAIE